ncbi:MAG: DUF503 domain-containing protein [Planctomycetota bacterium]
MKIGVLRCVLHIPQAGSLKDKRQVIRSLRDRLFSRFNVSVTEVDQNDKWQRATLGIATVSRDAKGAAAYLHEIEEFVRAHPGAQVVDLESAVEDFEEAGYGDAQGWSPNYDDE